MTPENEFDWFKKAWDAKMSEEHGSEWAQVLGGWGQRFFDDLEAGRTNAFSIFVHNETVRNFSETLALQVPGAVCALI